MPTLQLQFQGESQIAASDPEAQQAFGLLHPAASDSAIFVIRAEISSLQGDCLPLTPQQGIVTVEDDLAILPHAFHDLQLRPEDALLGAKMLNVHGADVDDHRHIRPCNGAEIRDFPEMVHAHFYHRHFGAVCHTQDGHGHTDVIVEVGRGLAHPEATGKDGSDHFLGSTLTDGAGNADHLHAQALPLLTGDIAQGPASIRHHNGRIIAIAMLAKHRSRALFQSHGNKVMTVPGRLQCDEKLTGLDFSGIVAGTQEGDLRIFRINLATAPCGSLG